MKVMSANTKLSSPPNKREAGRIKNHSTSFRQIVGFACNKPLITGGTLCAFATLVATLTSRFSPVLMPLFGISATLLFAWEIYLNMLRNLKLR